MWLYSQGKQLILVLGLSKVSLGRVRSLGHDSFLPDLLFTVPPLNDSSALFTVSLVFWPVNVNHAPYILHIHSNAGTFFWFLSTQKKGGGGACDSTFKTYCRSPQTISMVYFCWWNDCAAIRILGKMYVGGTIYFTGNSFRRLLTAFWTQDGWWMKKGGETLYSIY